MTDIAETQPVDPPEPASHRERPETPAVLPDWMRSRAALWDQAKWSTRHGTHVTAFHLLRLPIYWLRLIAHSPRGLWRILHRLAVWAKDAPGATMSVTLVQSGESKGPEAGNFLKVRKDHHNAVASRITTLLFLAAAVTAAVYLVPWTRLLVAANVVAVLTVLGAIGKPADRRVTSRSVDTEKNPKLTADVIVTALASMGISELNKAITKHGDKGVRFVSPITRDGPGWRADIELPPGVTASKVISERERLASGLRRQLNCVWPEGDAESHAGRLILWVGDKPMSASKPIPWPLKKAGKVDLFEPFPIGIDPRGNPVTITLVYASMIVGAIPRMGKTFLLRLILLAAALDPTAQLHIFDLKGGADFMPLEPVAHRFRVGDTPEDIDYLVDDLREIAADMQRRYAEVRGATREECPESKTTRALADQHERGLFPVVIVLDECQLAFQDDRRGKEIKALITDLIKRGPAAGIIVMLGTQKPDNESLPSSISANAVLRFCLKVISPEANNAVLGAGAYGAGIQATMFTRSDKGIGYLAGEEDDPIITRTHYEDANGAEEIVKRARSARLAAGLLTGDAVQDVTPQDAPRRQMVLDHLAEIWPLGEERVWVEDLADRLRTAYPNRYPKLTAAILTSMCKPFQLYSFQLNRRVEGAQTNRRAMSRADLAVALQARDEGQLKVTRPITDARVRQLDYQKKASAISKGAAVVEDIATWDVYERDGWRCALCGDHVDKELRYPDPMSASLDHAIPLSKGGSHTMDNVRLSHLRCNVVRGNREAETLSDVLAPDARAS